MARALERVFASRLPTRRSDQAIASDLFKNVALKAKGHPGLCSGALFVVENWRKNSEVCSRLLDHGRRSAA
jgi:hypothetical protein